MGEDRGENNSIGEITTLWSKRSCRTYTRCIARNCAAELLAVRFPRINFKSRENALREINFVLQIRLYNEPNLCWSLCFVNDIISNRLPSELIVSRSQHADYCNIIIDFLHSVTHKQKPRDTACLKIWNCLGAISESALIRPIAT